MNASTTLNFAPNASGTPDLRSVTYKYFYVRSATNPIQVSYDGGRTFEVLKANDRRTMHKETNFVSVMSYNGIAAVATLVFSMTPIQPQTTAISAQQTSIIGSFGLQVGITEVVPGTVGLPVLRPSVTNDGYVALTTNGQHPYYIVSNGQAGPGFARQILRIKMVTAAVASSLGYTNVNPLKIFDSNGYIVEVLQPGDVITLPTSDVLWLSGATAYFNASEIYLQQSQ